MRPGSEYFPSMAHGAPTGAPNATAPHSPWQSPVPYLFGGLAAMLGLIAFALLILACSYWKLSGYLDADRDRRTGGSSGDAGADGEKGSAAGAARPAAGFLEHVVVIMAGEERPTFLATPAASRAVVELGATPPAVPGSASGAETKARAVDDDGACDCEEAEHRRLAVAADAGTVSSSRESSSSSSSTTAPLAE
ncbi:hypothetical protein U9M48_026747 [Paspalum notatum var. saurae]|uniref:Uncharacterized protein n=1 Tax=Paspalum notatum var. saurae TaxID=547442 RepID=A0AAQ3WZH1_PASNO